MRYAFWNNKGGTGKTSLAFQAICRYAEIFGDRRILAIDICPQANLSELLPGRPNRQRRPASIETAGFGATL